MIIGSGVDLCEQKRIQKTIEAFGQRFLDRLFTDGEKQLAERAHARRVARYAQFFAAKEACSKALGTGLRQGVFWRDMEVYSLPSGKPMMRLHGGALARLQSLTPQGREVDIELSLSDEAGLTLAQVLIFIKLS